MRLLSGFIAAYTEQVEENDYLKYIREEVENAEIIVFLGFGFYAPNFRLISSGRKSNVRRIYGTALNLSKSGIDETISQISQTIFVSSRDSGARSRALAAERTELRKI